MGGGIPRSWRARREKTMLRTHAAAGVGEAELPAGCWAGGLSAGVMRAAGRASQSGREASGRQRGGGAFSQLSLCKPKAHEGNLCLT